MPVASDVSLESDFRRLSTEKVKKGVSQKKYSDRQRENIIRMFKSKS